MSVVVGAIAVTALTLTAACGDSGSPGASGSSPASGPPVVPSPSEVVESPSAGPADGATVTVSGTLSEGAEAGCVLLRKYLLVGGPRELLRPGRAVRVTGQVVTGVMTTCQQGTPLKVQVVEPGPLNP